ncbi:hypothetical protein KCP69_24945 [Salmonella enterica subsp. enterica]|nr:hypothetical protein KCP69_24945 [Salmonella enterica subsp. enterica]
MCWLMKGTDLLYRVQAVTRWRRCRQRAINVPPCSVRASELLSATVDFLTLAAPGAVKNSAVWRRRRTCKLPKILARLCANAASGSTSGEMQA